MPVIDAAPARPERLAAVAGAQFVAITAIVARHYAHYLQPIAPGLADALASLDFCEFFFAASGFFTATAARRRGGAPTLGHAARQLRKLYPLHLATMAFFTAAVLFGGMAGSLNGVPLGRCLAAQATLVHAYGLLPALCLNYPSWFLSAVFGMYLAAPLLALVARPPYGLALALLAVLALEWLGAGLGTRHWTSWTFDGGVLRALPSFLFGMAFARISLAPRPAAAPLASVCLAASLALMLAGAVPLVAKAALQWLLLVLLVTGERAGAASWLGDPRLDRWGRVAFPLFLLHAPAAAVLMNVVALRLLHLQGAAVVAALIVTFAAALAAALGYQRLMEGRA